MRPTAPIHEVFSMRFTEVNERFSRGRLSTDEAAQLLGVSVSTFYRKRHRFASEGEQGLVDQRIGKISSKRLPVDEAMRLISLFETKYFDFTVKHFHEHLAGHGIKRSYTLVKNTLQQAGVVKKAKRRGQHHRKRQRKPMPGMMLHQDGSSHEWVAGQKWDLIVTMDDATSEIYSMFFCDEEGTMSSFIGIKEVIERKGLFCSFYIDRGSHYFFTPKAGGKVDKVQLTQVGRAMKQLGIEMIAAYSPEARGRSERMFGTLQKRLPQELRLHHITDMAAANRFLQEVFLPKHNAQFAKQAAENDSAFVPLHNYPVADILCIQEKRTVANDNTVRYKGRIIQIEPDNHRQHYVKNTVQVHEYPDESLSVFHGPRRLESAEIQKADKEEELWDEFNALNPSSEWGKEEGEDSPSPFSDLGYQHGAQVALQRSPILRMTKNVSATQVRA